MSEMMIHMNMMMKLMQKNVAVNVVPGPSISHHTINHLNVSILATQIPEAPIIQAIYEARSEVNQLV